MKSTSTLICWLLFSLLLMSTSLWAQQPAISAVTPAATQVEKWGKFEATVTATATYFNPYDYDQVWVKATFTSPTGVVATVDGFYLQNYQISNTSNGALTTLGAPTFMVRFAPNETGQWSYVVSMTDANGTGTFAAQTFTCNAASGDQNQGFVRHQGSNYLKFDDDSQYIPLGNNIAWQSGNAYVSYNNWVTKLSNNGGNFFRLWQCAWGLGIEWRNSGYEGLRKYKQDNSYYQDWLFDFCAEKGVYVMLCLQHHGQVSSQVNPNWSESPYNVANGGMCTNTWDFFTNAAARAATKNRLRYVVARWGYSRAIMCWELFNEVNWTDDFTNHQNEVAAWHQEMATFIKSIDPYQHLVSTSYAYDYYDPVVWMMPEIDLTQTHYYAGVSNIERVLGNGVKTYLEDFGKPTINGEFGLTTSGSGLSSTDPNGIHLHNGIWGSIFSGGMGSAALWWWDNYIEPRNLYPVYQTISQLVPNIPFRQAQFAPANSYVLGASSDLIITPGQGWGALADTSYVINAAGQISPAAANLSEYLYGSQWNTEYRRPPVFTLNYALPGAFKVRTGGSTGTTPKIAIWLDGVMLLEQTATINTTFTIQVPAGAHTIKVDNTGTDWVTIASYTFTGSGSAGDSYALMSGDGQKVSAWVLNNRYNHEYVKANGNPPVLTNGTLVVPGMANGNYFANWYDCQSGAWIAHTPITVVNDTLTIALPAVQWDLALVVDGTAVNIEKIPAELSMNLYPNPIADETLYVDFELEQAGTITWEVIALDGRILQSGDTEVFAPGVQQLSFGWVNNLPAGFYWVKITAENRAGAKPFVVRR